ncbi:hypothetical protein GCK32_007084 [Trichostrongylus colubriformis]|uniref:Uncharacterized protein n=1 Tax=Trichostrongylus colubriformis TaxID=6319 RepID=A0AAN8G4J6_TRICO
MNECKEKFGVMPFTLRAFEDEVKAKMGVVEPEKHGLLRPYQDPELIATLNSQLKKKKKKPAKKEAPTAAINANTTVAEPVAAK